MRKRFPRFRAGEPLTSEVTARKLNALAEGLEERTPGEGKGTRLKTSSFGFTYSADPGGGSSSTPLPFKLTSAAGVEEGTREVTVRPSVIYNLENDTTTPTIDGTAIDAETTPTLTVANFGSVYLKVTVVPGVAGPFNGQDVNDQAVTYYQASAGNSTVTAGVEIVNDNSGSQVATVNYATGATQTGVFYFKLGSLSSGQPTNNAYGPISAEVEEVEVWNSALGFSIPSFVQVSWTVAQYNVP